MSKYDCNKILDCVHELKRLCDGNRKCEEGCGCPLYGHSCSPWSFTQTEIGILQKWSDENPEAPKLTKKDRMFLECFEGVESSEGLESRKIDVDAVGRVFYYYGHVYSLLSGDMFKGLKPNTTMAFEELMKLEVEE